MAIQEHWIISRNKEVPIKENKDNKKKDVIYARIHYTQSEGVIIFLLNSSRDFIQYPVGYEENMMMDLICQDRNLWVNLWIPTLNFVLIEELIPYHDNCHRC